MDTQTFNSESPPGSKAVLPEMLERDSLMDAALWICDAGTASPGGASLQLAANGGVFATPSGYKPAGAVSLFGAVTGQSFAARRW